MYLIIHEDGNLETALTLTDGDFKAVDDGIIDIVDVTGLQPVVYHDGSWYGINRAGT